MNKPIKTTASKIRFECPWYRVRQDEIVLPDGSTGQYNVVESPACVFVVPVTPQNEVMLIHQYRYTMDSWIWEIPAGAVHEGQTLLAAAQQELREEVGGTSEAWHYLGEVNTANGRSNEVAHLYLACDVELGKWAHESAEIITIHPTPFAQALQMVYTNQLQDGPSALALLLADHHLQN